MSERDDGSAVPDEVRADRLKERVYVTFTALAVVLALRSHAESAGTAVGTLVIAVLGTVLAVFVADVVSHIAVHAALPARAELRHMASVSFGSLSVLVVPLVLVGLAAARVWQLDRALRVAAFVLVATLALVGYVAVRRVRLPVGQKLVILFGEFALGVLVVLLELLAHG